MSCCSYKMQVFYFASTPTHHHGNPYQAPRPLPCCCKCPRATRFRKCCFKVLRLAAVSFTASAIVTRLCFHANSTICSDSSGSVANTSFSCSTFFSSLCTCSASDRKKKTSDDFVSFFAPFRGVKFNYGLNCEVASLLTALFCQPLGAPKCQPPSHASTHCQKLLTQR